MDAGIFLDEMPSYGRCSFPEAGSDLCAEDVEDRKRTGGRAVTIGEQFRLGYALWGGEPNQACARAKARDAHKCYFVGAALEHTRSPVFITESLEDCWQLGWHGDPPRVGKTSPPPAHVPSQWCTAAGSFNASQRAYVYGMRSRMRASLEHVPSRHHVFAPSCYTHSVAWGEPLAWRRLYIGRVSLHEAFSLYHREREAMGADVLGGAEGEAAGGALDGERGNDSLFNSGHHPVPALDGEVMAAAGGGGGGSGSSWRVHLDRCEGLACTVGCSSL